MIKFVGWLAWFRTNEADKYITPISVSFNLQNHIRFMLHVSTTLSSTLTLDGTLDNYIRYVESPIGGWCGSNAATDPFQLGIMDGAKSTVLPTESTITWTQTLHHHYYGRHCYKPSATNVVTFCEVVDGQFQNINVADKYMIYATTQDRYYSDQLYHELGIFEPDDDTARLFYPNGNGVTNGKFIAINHNHQTLA